MSPPGQVVVATVNAEQRQVLGLSSFRKLYSLVLALRNRPPAFNSGARYAVTAPDVLILQEMTYSNLEIFQKLLSQSSEYDYQIVATDGAQPKFLYNAATVGLLSPPTTWVDPCKTGADGDDMRMYQMARFVENASGTPFTVAGVHFSKSYRNAGGQQCRTSNALEVRRQLLPETNPVIVGGDFNFRSTVGYRECDPDERSEPTEWYSIMTSSINGVDGFVDSVRDWHRRRNATMFSQWTHEKGTASLTCTSVQQPRRSRIDYLFTRGAVTAAATADDPGWAGQIPGTRNIGTARYSDHRFIIGRFVLGGPPRPSAPVATPAERGAIELSWTPLEGASGYVLYRAKPRAAYWSMARLDATATTFIDTETTHGQRYRYSVVAVGPNGAHSQESRSAAAIADALGPRVTSMTPWSGAPQVDRTAPIVVRFDERIDPESVDGNTVRLVMKAKWRTGRDQLIRGIVRVLSSHSIEFDPFNRLADKRVFGVTVRSLRDQLGNRGRYFFSHFST